MPSLFPAAFLPPVHYMAEALRSDAIRIEGWETYRKQTCRNHCEIGGPNGRQTLTVPVRKADGNRTKTRDIQILYDTPWQKLHWRSIETAYNHSPFFLYYQDAFRPFFETPYRYLLELNVEILTALLSLLKTPLPVEVSGQYEIAPAGLRDLRPALGSKHTHRTITFPPYPQVFETRNGFLPGLSILDAVFNLGPETPLYLDSIR